LHVQIEKVLSRIGSPCRADDVPSVFCILSRELQPNATIRAGDGVELLSVSATLLEQVSTACQLRFTRVFLDTLIQRLQGTT